ncbi:hypothetical protein [Anaerosporobacter sp.]|uniref:hypothetical protein n=1 Tax=Anaerosporobacter sp. TaxID=1872529 RepID=UPI0028995028|nr:hypothetical protein [Anaerosporobacter sp.]
MEKLRFENYIYFPDKNIKFDELNDDEKDEFRRQMINILEEQTNLECRENSEEQTNKKLEDGENIPKMNK